MDLLGPLPTLGVFGVSSYATARQFSWWTVALSLSNADNVKTVLLKLTVFYFVSNSRFSYVENLLLFNFADFPVDFIKTLLHAPFLTFCLIIGDVDDSFSGKDPVPQF